MADEGGSWVSVGGGGSRWGDQIRNQGNERVARRQAKLADSRSVVVVVQQSAQTVQVVEAIVCKGRDGMKRLMEVGDEVKGSSDVCVRGWRCRRNARGRVASAGEGGEAKIFVLISRTT